MIEYEEKIVEEKIVCKSHIGDTKP